MRDCHESGRVKLHRKSGAVRRIALQIVRLDEHRVDIDISARESKNTSKRGATSWQKRTGKKKTETQN